MADTLKKPITPLTDGHTNGADHADDDTLVAAPTLPNPPATVEDIPMLTPKRGRWRLAIPIILIIAVAIGTGWFFFRPAKSAPTAIVRRGTIISTVETTGKLEAERSAKL